jgi:hypothetical protein
MQNDDYGTPYKNPPIGRWVPEWWLLSKLKVQAGKAASAERWMVKHEDLLSTAKSCWGVPAVVADSVPDAQKSQQCRMRMPQAAEENACV